MKVWEEIRKIRAYSSLQKDEQTRIIDLLLDKKNVNLYYFDFLVFKIKDLVDDQTFYKIAINFILNGRASMLNDLYATSIVEKAYKTNPREVRKILFDSKAPALNKMLLMFGKCIEEEEIKGLRALSKSKYVPKRIHIRKYKPKLESLKKLPPIMRLNTLEALSNVNKLKYNIFGNFSEDEFKSLLFASSLKYTERIQTLQNKYSELKYVGLKSTIEVSGDCDFCGPYKMSLTSNVVRTVTGLKGTNLKMIAKPNCPFCFSKLQSNPEFKA